MRLKAALLEEKKEFIVTSVVDGGEAWAYLEDLKKKAASENKPVTDFLDIILSALKCWTWPDLGHVAPASI